MNGIEIDMALMAGGAYFYKRVEANQIPISISANLLSGVQLAGFEAKSYGYKDKVVISFSGTYFPDNGLLGKLSENGVSENKNASLQD